MYILVLINSQVCQECVTLQTARASNHIFSVYLVGDVIGAPNKLDPLHIHTSSLPYLHEILAYHLNVCMYVYMYICMSISIPVAFHTSKRNLPAT